MKHQSMAVFMIASAMAAMAQSAHTDVTRGIVNVRADMEIKATVAALNQAFATFKAEHTKELTDLKKGQSDALQALKVDAINAHITDLQAAVDLASTKMAAMEMGTTGARPVKDKEYSAAFSAHMKKAKSRRPSTKAPPPKAATWRRSNGIAPSPTA